MSLNGISTSTYKADRQSAKLELAKAKRQGYTVAANGSISGTADPTKPYYRDRNEYDITELPTIYTPGNNFTAEVTDNPNVGGLVYGRPWVTGIEPTFTEVTTEDGFTLTTEDGKLLIL